MKAVSLRVWQAHTLPRVAGERHARGIVRRLIRAPDPPVFARERENPPVCLTAIGRRRLQQEAYTSLLLWSARALQVRRLPLTASWERWRLTVLHFVRPDPLRAGASCRRLTAVHRVLRAAGGSRWPEWIAEFADAKGAFPLA
jgi:hypothetical protein